MTKTKLFAVTAALLAVLDVSAFGGTHLYGAAKIINARAQHVSSLDWHGLRQ